MTPTSIRDNLAESGTWFHFPKASDLRYILQGSNHQVHSRPVHTAVTGLVLLLIICLGGVGGFFSYQTSSQVGDAGPESHTLQGDQPFALVRNPELLVRLWQGENPRPQSGELPESTSDEFICLSSPFGAFPLEVSLEPAFFISLPVSNAQVISPQQPRAPPQALSV